MLNLSGNEQLVPGYWFISQLLVSSLISFFLMKWMKQPVFALAVILCFGLLFAYFDISFHLWHIGIKTFEASVFFITGYMFKGIKNRINVYHTILAFLFVLSVSLCWSTYMGNQNVFTFIPYIAIAVIGSIMTLGIGNLINQHNGYLSKFLTFAGDNSFSILTWHALSYKLASLLIIALYSRSIYDLAYFPTISNDGLWWVVYSLFGIVIPMILSLLYNGSKWNIYDKQLSKKIFGLSAINNH